MRSFCQAANQRSPCPKGGAGAGRWSGEVGCHERCGFSGRNGGLGNKHFPPIPYILSRGRRVTLTFSHHVLPPKGGRLFKVFSFFTAVPPSAGCWLWPVPGDLWWPCFFSSVQSLSHVQLFATPWTATHQASLCITNSQSLLKPMSIEPVMPSNHLILCHPLLLLLFSGLKQSLSFRPETEVRLKH